MSIRRKVGRFRFLVAAVLLAISTLALPAPAQPAHAQQGCAHDPNAIQFWGILYEDRGVTLCRGDVTSPPLADPSAYVQIVDLGAGANLRLISDAVDPEAPEDDDNQYNKREAIDWFDWIESNVTEHKPPGSLFSTTNASFFIDTEGSTTALSLPQMSAHEKGDGLGLAQPWTLGWAFGHNDDPAWDAQKRALRIDSPFTFPAQPVAISGFPTHYTRDDIVDALNPIPPTGTWDGVVAFHPSEGTGGARRTMVGVSGSGTNEKVYILTTGVPVTLSEAQDILQSFGSQIEIQLDGGGSTQTWIEYESTGEGLFSPFRAVPDVVAVYLAPE